MTDPIRLAGAPDPISIRLAQGYEIDFWTRRLGVSERVLRYAVAALGPSPEDVALFPRSR